MQTVDDATGPLGGPTLGEATRPVTERVDETVTGTLNNVGGLIGQDDLGNRTSDTLNDVTRHLLGGTEQTLGNVTHRLLGG